MMVLKKYRLLSVFSLLRAAEISIGSMPLLVTVISWPAICFRRVPCVYSRVEVSGHFAQSGLRGRHNAQGT